MQSSSESALRAWVLWPAGALRDRLPRPACPERIYEGSASSEESLLHILSAHLKFLAFRALPRNLWFFLV